MNDYDLIKAQISALIETDPHYIPVLSNAASILFQSMENASWAGFYLLKDGRLVVGPFQGKPACIHIEKGKGVCGTAWEKAETIIVPDVEEFPGHIACSSLSRSEIVVPLFSGGEVIGVLDIDREELDTFDGVDALWLERIAGHSEKILKGKYR